MTLDFKATLKLLIILNIKFYIDGSTILEETNVLHTEENTNSN